MLRATMFFSLSFILLAVPTGASADHDREKSTGTGYNAPTEQEKTGGQTLNGYRGYRGQTPESLQSSGQRAGEKGQDSSLDERVEEEIVITAERPLSASSDQTIRDKDFEYFPRRTASDLMRLVPGLHITQHTGGAKAHQFFLRGFDAEHGQDIRVTLDGIPLNQLSHVHGQG
ncbi:MAG: Plug domain-containing protein, partial [Deltaproteobacteria bacterium]